MEFEPPIHAMLDTFSNRTLNFEVVDHQSSFEVERSTTPSSWFDVRIQIIFLLSTLNPQRVTSTSVGPESGTEPLRPGDEGRCLERLPDRNS